MTVLESKLYPHVIKTEETSIGKLHYFENVVVSEINDGVHIDTENFLDLMIPLAKFYGTMKTVGYIANRINKYSVSPLEVSNLSFLKNLTTFSTITYNTSDLKTAKFEQRFCKTEMKHNFSNLYTAFNWVNELIANRVYIN